MQAYGRGLRRRLAPMMGGDQARLRMAYSLLFSLPGAPMLFYGEEIGMGEHLGLSQRLSVRTPMQWTPYGNGGFSSASPKRFVRPIVTGGDYGFEKVSVAAQRGDGGSLLNWMAGLIRTRRECGEIGTGKLQVLDTGDDAVLGLRYDFEGSTIVVVTNLSGQRRTIALELGDDEIATATDLFTDRRYAPLRARNRQMRIEGYGYRWLRLGGIY
jgi:maltose alpha-D-glucosyltransferase/alpha-amylase